MGLNGTPGECGYRMPAEWEPHSATWFSWPHNKRTWPEVLPRAEQALAHAVRVLASGETVHINVLDAEHETRVTRLIGSAASCIQFHHVPTDDAWCRDHGAVFVTGAGTRPPMLAINWDFNAWGHKYPRFDLDDAVPRAMAEALGAPAIDADMVLEGGSIEVNGTGTLLTTESCLLAPNRNPTLSRDGIERRLRDFLGVTHVLWLPGGDIAGDDTDGHVDNLARFVNESTVVAPLTDDPGDSNFEVLRRNFDALLTLAEEQDAGLNVVALPVPPAIRFRGRRLPASYANFLIGNEVILMPAFDCEEDAEAQAVLRSFFPAREVIAIDCRDVIVGNGALHCLSQQVPRAG